MGDIHMNIIAAPNRKRTEGTDMKKMVLAAWLLVFALALSGCTKATPASNVTSNRKQIVVGFSQVGSESNWRKANTVSMTQSLSEDRGYRLFFSDAQQSQSNQITAIRNFIKQKVDYIVVAPVTEQGWNEILIEARDAGIPVIIVDRMVDVQDESLFTCWVGTNPAKEGALAVQWMGAQFGDSPLRIAHLQGTLDSTAQRGRTTGLDEGLSEHPSWTLAFRDTGNFTQAQGRALVEKLLKDGVEFDLIYAENDDMAYGAVEALEAAGRIPGEDVTIISFDANLHALELAMEGKINYVIECNPLHGPRVEAVIQQLEAGETPQKYTYVDGTTFDRASITQELLDSREY